MADRPGPVNGNLPGVTQPPGGPYDNTSGQSGFGPRGGQQYPQWPPHSGGYSGRWSTDSSSSPYGWQSDSNRSGIPGESVYRGFGTFDEPARGGNRRRTRWGVVTGLTLAALLLASAITISIHYGTASSPSGGNVAADEERSSTTARTAPPAPEPEIDGWQVGYNERSRFAYDVPRDWSVLPSERSYTISGVPNVTFHGLVDGPSYRCGDRTLVAGRVVSALVEDEKPMSKTAEGLFEEAVTDFYATNGVDPDVSFEPAEPRETTVEGFDAVRLSGTVTLGGERSGDGKTGCLPEKATMATLVVQAREHYVVLVASADSERPASAPSAPGEKVVPRIVDSARTVR
ncbi:hypothetical protein SAMN04487819_10352 [Actinopolyspora alba]|uniref:DUF8017 domain-containing protein n=1 Tax=Actinopolyspora alba TaxID=673379 RepID=A0A1I1V299_9ACTN|nr:hypothetical protein SAMN04487819_10352 [Actinopolyspora alba]